MKIFSAADVIGDQIQLKTLHAGHLGADGKMPVSENDAGDFKSMLLKALEGVNTQQITSDQLTTKLITDPDSVNAHEVTIAMAKAEMSLSLTKSVLDTAIKAYKEIISLR